MDAKADAIGPAAVLAGLEDSFRPGNRSDDRHPRKVEDNTAVDKMAVEANTDSFAPANAAASKALKDRAADDSPDSDPKDTAAPTIFFKKKSAPRYLHSFPTRRSSD